MIPAPQTREAARQSLLDRIDSAGGAGAIKFVTTGGSTVVNVPLQYPAGLTTESGISLHLTEYAQVAQTAEIAKAIVENGAGSWVADLSVGLSTDNPAPDIILPALRLFAGAFVRLSATVDCY